MKRYLDELLGRQPLPGRSDAYFPLNPMPHALLRCRNLRKAPPARRPVPAKPPVSRR